MLSYRRYVNHVKLFQETENISPEPAARCACKRMPNIGSFRPEATVSDFGIAQSDHLYVVLFLNLENVSSHTPAVGP
jgi:hypothetical protein